MEEKCKPHLPVGSSRPGLISDGSEPSFSGTTVMRESYQALKPPEVPKRRKEELFKRFLWEQQAKELIEKLKEIGTDDPTPKTEYEESFERGEIKDLATNIEPELIAKYPLYTDPAKSFYFCKRHLIKGLNLPKDPNKAFHKRNRPFYAELED